MKIIIASENKEKLRGVKKVFPNADIISLRAQSYIGDSAFETSLFLGAYNRIRLGVLQDYNLKEEDWDIIVGLQSGYVARNNKYYITDVCVVLDKNGYRFGNGPMFEISRVLYEAAGKGAKLDVLIDDASRNSGVSSVLEYISEGVLNRAQAMTMAVSGAMSSEHKNISEHGFNYDSVITFNNKNTKALVKKCYDIDYSLVYYSEPEKE